MCQFPVYVSADLCNSLCTDERTSPMRLSDLSKVIWPLRGRVGIQTGQSDSKVSGLITQPYHWELLESGKRRAS